MSPIFFPTPADFRKWLEENHEKETELLVGFYKKGSGKPSITWPESVDEALCFGWIDGVRKSIDEESYTIRFTPRKKKSHWSNVNIKRIQELKEAGLVKKHGWDTFLKREEKNSARASYEQEKVEFPLEFEKTFRSNEAAWEWFQAQAPSYRRAATWWVIQAKQEATRQKRLAILISDSAAGQRIPPLRWSK